MSVLWSQNPRLINTYAEKFSSLTYFYPPFGIFGNAPYICSVNTDINTNISIKIFC